MLERVTAKRARRGTLRKAQAAVLAICVLAATAGGFALLRSAFDADRSDVGQMPPLAANGQIVFAREGEDGRSHIFAVRPDGSGVRQITEGDATDTDPAVSPDGRTIAFVRIYEEYRQLIATIGIDGGEVTHRSEDYLNAEDPAWSPNGRTIVYVTTGIDSQQLYSTGLETGRTRGLIDFFGQLADPTWSADSTDIAFAGRGYQDVLASGSWDLATIAAGAENGEIEPLLVTEGDEEAPSWSPDGTRIAFTRPGEEGDEVWTIDPDGGSETLLATAIEASLEPDLAWAPDGSALLVSDGEWIYKVDATPSGDPGGNFDQLVRGVSPSWQPVPARLDSATASPEPSVSPSPEPEGKDVGLGFNLCGSSRLGGIDFFGDGTMGTAWTGNKASSDGACPGIEDHRFGVAVDFTGDGIADSWSGETIEGCTGCEPFRAMDLNGDGREELIVILEYFSIMHYGLYAVVDVNGEPEVVPFRTGEPGHPEHSLDAGKPFTFWVGGDGGSSDWFYCETLPTFWITGVFSPEGGPGATVHVTQVSLGTDGIAEILYADTYTVPPDVQLELPYTSPDFSDPNCGMGVRPG